MVVLTREGLDAAAPPPASTRRPRGGLYEHFPERLHQMLRDAERRGMSDVVSFCPHGRAFGVHDMDRFVEDVLPSCFSHNRRGSFFRQLLLYGFRRITRGQDKGCWYHELFLQCRPDLCMHMRRVGVHRRGEPDRRRKLKSQQPLLPVEGGAAAAAATVSGSQHLEKEEQDPPDFYVMKPACWRKAAGTAASTAARGRVERWRHG